MNIVKTCEKIGRDLIPAVKNNNGKLSTEAVKTVLEKNLGKKSDKIIITDNVDTFVNFCKKIGMDKKSAQMYYDSSLSAVVPSIKNDKICCV